MSLCCRVSSEQALQSVISNTMLIVVNCDVFLCCSSWTIWRVPYNAMQCGCMRAQHKVVLYVDARHVWLTRQEFPGIRSQNRNAKLTRLFLSCEWAGPQDQLCST